MLSNFARIADTYGSSYFGLVFICQGSRASDVCPPTCVSAGC